MHVVFIRLGLPGKKLDNLRLMSKDQQVHERWTAMMEIRYNANARCYFDNYLRSRDLLLI
jgi:hypothetical protein